MRFRAGWSGARGPLVAGPRHSRAGLRLAAWDRAAILDAMNQAVSRLYAYEKPGDEAGEISA